jgi:hypothetical protein
MGQDKPESLFDSISRMGRAKKATVDTGGDMVTNLQNFAKSEAERKRKEAEDAKKKATTVNTAPEKGFLQKMYEKYVGGSKEQ